MRFTIEQRHLTDSSGRPIGSNEAVSFHSCVADTADAAVRLFVGDRSAEVIGQVLQFPGFQAVATIRDATGVFTLQVAPSSQQFVAH